MFWGNLVSLLVVFWSVIALATTADSLDTDPFIRRLILGVMGFLFLAIGMAVFLRNRREPVFLFWLYCAFSCMHWGGVIGDGAGRAGLVLVAAYALFASAIPQSLFVHLATSFPNHRIVKWRYLTVIYAPVILGALMLTLAIFGAVSLEMIYVVISASVLYSVIGGMFWIYKIATTTYFTPIIRGTLVGALLVGWLPHIAANAGWVCLGDYEVLAFLPLLAIPLTLAWIYDRSTMLN